MQSTPLPLAVEDGRARILLQRTLRAVADGSQRLSSKRSQKHLHGGACQRICGIVHDARERTCGGKRFSGRVALSTAMFIA